MGARAFGMEDLVVEPEEEDSMGHIVVTGDINVSDPASLQSAMAALSGKELPQHQPQENPAPSPMPEVARPNIAPVSEGAWGPLLQKALLATALLTGGGGIATLGSWALGAFDHPTPPAVVDTDTDTRTSWAAATHNQDR